jgi:hypothetical protein
VKNEQALTKKHFAPDFSIHPITELPSNQPSPWSHLEPYPGSESRTPHLKHITTLVQLYRKQTESEVGDEGVDDSRA